MWDTVLAVFVGVLFAVVLVIALLCLVTLPALLLAFWWGRRRDRRDRSAPWAEPGPRADEDGPW